MMRKDRKGIAIQKGSKKHKITFRDEIGGYEAKTHLNQLANDHSRTNSVQVELTPKTLPIDILEDSASANKRNLTEVEKVEVSSFSVASPLDAASLNL